MKKSSCEGMVSQNFPLITDVDDFRLTYIANCAFNSFLCYNVFMFKIVTIHALRKTSSLPRTLKTLLLSLAVSDVGVGLLAEPFYISLLVNWLQEKAPSCDAFKVFEMVMGLFPIASFLGVVSVSADRFLAIQFHLKYQELVTHKRVVAVVTSIWFFSVSFSFIGLWVPPGIKFMSFCVGRVVGFLLTTMTYLKIYLVVRRHKNQIQTLQVQHLTQPSATQSFPSLRKSSVGMFYVYVVFWICYLPFIVCSAAVQTANSPSIAWKRFFLFSYVLEYLNSSLNPVIYCWKMRHVRHAVIDTLRKIFCLT